MEIKLIKFGTVSAIDKFIAQHEINLHKLKTTPYHIFNKEKLSAIPKWKKILFILKIIEPKC